MSNFGFTDLRLVNPYELAFKEARSAVRSRYILDQTQVFDTVAAAIHDCTLVVGTTAVGNRDLHVPLYQLETAVGPIQKALFSSPPPTLLPSLKVEPSYTRIG